MKLCHLSVHHRPWHRGRVRGHQFGDRRADTSAAQGPDRPDRQRELLYRGGDRRGATILLLKPNLLPVDLGWRLGFGIGGLLGLTILILRRHLPESPRCVPRTGLEHSLYRFWRRTVTPI